MSGPCTCGFVCVAGSYPVMIPANSVASIAVTGPACGPAAMVELLSVPVQGNIQVANTLVNASKTCFHIQVEKPLLIKEIFGSSHEQALVQRMVQS